MSHNAAFVTLLTKTEYLPGALVVHQSLVDVGSKYPFVVMVTPAVCERDREIMRKRGMRLRDIESLTPEEGTHTVADHDNRFRDTWTKLRYVVDLSSVRGGVINHRFRAFELAEYDVS